MFELRQTCACAPEQYDVYRDGNKVGYLRLRHGRFRAEHNGKIVYNADTLGDGMFVDSERDEHLTAACEAIMKAMSEKPLYIITGKMEIGE